MARITKTKPAPKPRKTSAKRLAEQSAKIEKQVVEENRRLLIQARDRVRKYNTRFGTDYKINETGFNLKDPDLYKKLNIYTTKNIKSGAVKIGEDLIPWRMVNGIELTKEEYKQMQALENKANRIRTNALRDIVKQEYKKGLISQEEYRQALKNINANKYYNNRYFASHRGYERYMKVLEENSTREGYMKNIYHGLQTFKQNVLNHLDDLILIETDADKKAEYNALYDEFNKNYNTYSRLEKAYNYFKAKYTPEQMARLFFDSDPTRNKFLFGEDIPFINTLKSMLGLFNYKGPATRSQMTQLDIDNPVDV